MSIWSHLGRSRLRAEDNRKPHHPVTLRTSTVATIRILPHWEIIRSRHSFSSGLAPRITTAARRFGLYRVLPPPVLAARRCNPRSLAYSSRTLVVYIAG